MFTRQFKVQIVKNTLINLIYPGKVPNLAGIEHSSVHFFYHRQRRLHFSIKKGTELSCLNRPTK